MKPTSSGLFTFESTAFKSKMATGGHFGYGRRNLSAATGPLNSPGKRLCKFFPGYISSQL